MKKVVQNLSWIILGLFLVLLPLNTKADSGWDNSYDSGGSYSSSDSWSSSNDSWSSSDYGYSSGGSHYSGEIPTFVYMIGLIVFIILIIYGAKNNKSNSIFVNTEDLPLAVRDTFNLYLKIQNAWSQFDYDSLEKLLSDELYNNYKMQLETLKMKQQKNLMEDFRLIDGHIVNSQEINGHQEMVISMTVRLKDYVINTTDYKVVRGSAQAVLEVTYEITLIKELGEKLDNCPSCGSPIKDKGRSVCEYCGSTIVQGTDKYVMSKKETKNQRTLH